MTGRFLPLLKFGRVKIGQKAMIKKVNGFFSEVRTEMGKVTWPTREELIGSTGVVLMTMFIIVVFVGIADLAFSFFLSHLLR
jgi:preprotein translocase subunit SecE